MATFTAALPIDAAEPLLAISKQIRPFEVRSRFTPGLLFTKPALSQDYRLSPCSLRGYRIGIKHLRSLVVSAKKGVDIVSIEDKGDGTLIFHFGDEEGSDVSKPIKDEKLPKRPASKFVKKTPKSPLRKPPGPKPADQLLVSDEEQGVAVSEEKTLPDKLPRNPSIFKKRSPITKKTTPPISLVVAKDNPKKKSSIPEIVVPVRYHSTFVKKSPIVNRIPLRTNPRQVPPAISDTNTEDALHSEPLDSLTDSESDGNGLLSHSPKPARKSRRIRKTPTILYSESYTKSLKAASSGFSKKASAGGRFVNEGQGINGAAAIESLSESEDTQEKETNRESKRETSDKNDEFDSDSGVIAENNTKSPASERSADEVKVNEVTKSEDKEENEVEVAEGNKSKSRQKRLRKSKVKLEASGNEKIMSELSETESEIEEAVENIRSEISQTLSAVDEIISADSFKKFDGSDVIQHPEQNASEGIAGQRKTDQIFKGAVGDQNDQSGQSDKEDFDDALLKLKAKRPKKSPRVKLWQDPEKDRTPEPPPQDWDLNLLTLLELKDIARTNGLKGYSRLKKAELIELIRLNNSNGDANS